MPALPCQTRNLRSAASRMGRILHRADGHLLGAAKSGEGVLTADYGRAMALLARSRITTLSPDISAES